MQEQERILAARQARQARQAAQQAAQRGNQQVGPRCRLAPCAGERALVLCYFYLVWPPIPAPRSLYRASRDQAPQLMLLAIDRTPSTCPSPLQEAEDEEGRRREPKFGEPGFRFHASIPQARPPPLRTPS